ncbi:MAG: hypothetical protein P4M08_07810 [Oligoflexia bacterium]|nr:hypothetical protein [Oligoflexia bacterium]
MANPSTSAEKKIEAANREAQREALELMEGASERANELYARANSWFNENRRTVYSGAALLAVGAIGFLIGKNFFGQHSNE